MDGELRNLAEIAGEASRCVYTAESSPDYALAPLIKDTLEVGERHNVHPVAVAGKFSVKGSGLYSAFIDTDPHLAAVLPASDIEDCASAGQYLLDTDHLLMSAVETEEVEEFVGSQEILARNNVSLKLLAGIQVMYSPERQELMPFLVYHRALGGVTFYKREKLAEALSVKNRTADELLHLAEPADRAHCSIFLFPDEAVVERMGEAAARLLLIDESIRYY